MPMGSVIFELVQKNHKTKVLAKVMLKDGKATLRVGKPSTVLNKSIKVIYSGNPNFEPQTSAVLREVVKKAKKLRKKR